MKLGIVGKECPELKAELVRRGAELVDPAKAEIIVSYGGDGSMLGAERSYPGIPKFPIRDSETAPLCPVHTLSRQLDLFFAGKLAETKLPKLEGTVNGRDRLYGVNDIFIHSKIITSALRYRVWIDDKVYAYEIIGDGAGVSTVHGSTAYYRSITHSIFRIGIGLAFSNSTELVNHLVLPERSVVRIRITRGPAEAVSDNAPDMPIMNTGDECVIRLSGLTARILGLEMFMCPDCRTLRHRLRSECIRKGNRP